MVGGLCSLFYFRDNLHLHSFDVNPAITSSSSLSSSAAPPLSSSPLHARPNESSSIDSTSKLLCHTFGGRLGNELFQYSATLALALTMNRTPVFSRARFLPTVLKTFSVPSANLTQLRTRCQHAKSAKEISCHKYTEKLAHLDPDFDYKIGLYFATYRYFEKHQPYIREALTFSDAVRKESEQYVQTFRRKYRSSTLIGVHLRRGDVAREDKQILGYPMASPDYVSRAVALFEARYPSSVFVVGSDSLQWWRKHFPRGHRVEFLDQPPHAPAVDMMILASLDHTITSYGSFSWWVGYFNRGTTVFMKDFILNGTMIGNSFHPNGEGYVYPGWIPL